MDSYLFLFMLSSISAISKLIQGGMNWEIGVDKYILFINTKYKIDKQWEPALPHRELSSALCGDLNGKEIQERGCMYMYSRFTLLYSKN